jgi:hypothetical protein
MLPPSVLAAMNRILRRRGVVLDERSGETYGDLRVLANEQYFDDVPAGDRHYGNLRVTPREGDYHAPDPSNQYGRPPDPGGSDAPLYGQPPEPGGSETSPYGRPPDPAQYAETPTESRHEPQESGHPHERPLSAAQVRARLGLPPGMSADQADTRVAPTPAPIPAPGLREQGREYREAMQHWNPENYEQILESRRRGAEQPTDAEGEAEAPAAGEEEEKAGGEP